MWECCECEEEYYSISARNILVRAEETRKARIVSRTAIKNRNQASVHPFDEVVAGLSAP